MEGVFLYCGQHICGMLMENWISLPLECNLILRKLFIAIYSLEEQTILYLHYLYN